MRWIKQAAAVAVLTTLIGCSGDESAIRVAPVPSISAHIDTKTLWSTSVGDGVGTYYTSLKPAVADGIIYSASRDGTIIAVNADSGDTLWKVEATPDSDESPLLSGGIAVGFNHLYIGTENGQLMAFNIEDGSKVWSKNVEGGVLSTPLLTNNMVVINTTSGVLQALSIDNGDTIWQIKNEVPTLSLRGDSSPTSFYGGIFWGSANGRIQAVGERTGQLVWQKIVGRAKGDTEIDRLVDVDAQPIVYGDKLWIIGYHGSLVAVDLRSGQVVLHRAYSSAKNMAVDSSRLFIVDDKDHVIAIDMRSGTELWQNQNLEYRDLTPPSVIDGYVVVADSEGFLYWIDENTGLFSSKQKISDEGLNVAPIALDDGYLLQTREGELIKQQINY